VVYFLFFLQEAKRLKVLYNGHGTAVTPRGDRADREMGVDRRPTFNQQQDAQDGKV